MLLRHRPYRPSQQLACAHRRSRPFHGAPRLCTRAHDLSLDPDTYTLAEDSEEDDDDYGLVKDSAPRQGQLHNAGQASTSDGVCYAFAIGFAHINAPSPARCSDPCLSPCASSHASPAKLSPPRPPRRPTWLASCCKKPRSRCTRPQSTSHTPPASRNRRSNACHPGSNPSSATYQRYNTLP